jgi:hypothetical protein
MPVIIDGSANTISGVSVGGFPAGSIATNDLINNSVTNIKLGYGVVQTQYVNSGTKVTIAPGTTFTEASSNYRVSITPYFSNSIIKIHYMIPMSYGSGWSAGSISRINAVRFVSGSAQSISTAGTANGSRPGIAGFAQRPSNGYDSNDPARAIFTVYDAPNTTSAIQYGFQASIQTGNMYFGYSNSDNGSWGWTANVVIIAQEIKQ